MYTPLSITFWKAALSQQNTKMNNNNDITSSNILQINPHHNKTKVNAKFGKVINQNQTRDIITSQNDANFRLLAQQSMDSAENTSSSYKIPIHQKLPYPNYQHELLWLNQIIATTKKERRKKKNKKKQQ